MAKIDFPKKQEQRLIPKYLLEYAEELQENHPDPTDPWGGSGGDVNIEAGTGITITTESDDTKVISLDTTPSTFEVTASTGMTLEVENSNPLWKDSKLQMSSVGATRLEGTQISLEANNIYLNSDNAPYYVNNTTHEYKTLATTDQITNVSGTNDGTDWTSLTIGNDTYGLASGGTTYTAGTGIDITNDTISVDNTVAMKTDLPSGQHDTYNWTSLTIDSDTYGIPQIPDGNVVLVNQTDNDYIQKVNDNWPNVLFRVSNFPDPEITFIPTYEQNDKYYFKSITSETVGSEVTHKVLILEFNKMSGVAGITEESISNNYNDLINTPTIPVVPTDVSAFNNDVGYITGINSSDVINALGYTPGTSNFSGSYNDLTDKPTIPTATSQLTNDSGFITNSDQNVEYIFITSTSSTPQPFTLTNDQIDAIVLNPTKYIIVYDYQPTLGEPRIYFRYQYQNGTYFNYASLDYYKDEISSSGVYGYRYRKCQFTLTVSGTNKGTITMTNANQDYQKMLTTGTGISMSNNEISVNTNTIATRTWVGNQGYLTSSDISNMVTTDTDQTITGRKTIVGSTVGLYVQSGATYTSSDTKILPGEIDTRSISSVAAYSNEFAMPDVTTAGNGQIRVRDFNNNLTDYRITVPTKNGTMALTSDIPTVPTTATSTSTLTPTTSSFMTSTTKTTETLTFTYADNTTANITIVTGVTDNTSSAMTGATVTTTTTLS